MNNDNFIAKFSSGFLKKSRATFLIFFGVLALGYFSYSTLLTREGFPSIDVPFAIIQVPYFVNDKEQVDNNVTKPIEDKISELSNIKSIDSSTTENFSLIFTEFDGGITSQEGTDMIKEKIADDLAVSKLELNYVSFDAAKFNGKYDIILNIAGTSSINEIQESADKFAVELEKVEGVLVAEPIELIEKQTNPITGEEIDYKSGFNRIGFKDEDELKFYSAIAIGLKKDANVDTIEFSETINFEIDKYTNEALEEELQIINTADYAVDLNNNISSLESNFLSGMIAVVVVLFFFINWRSALTTVIFIPTVLMGSFFALFLIGYSLNVISLFSLILVLGLFVDDAIVVVEAIDYQKKNGLRAVAAVKKAISEIGVADVSGTITTVLVFAPMVFTSGILGEFIRAIPITVIISLIISLITALSVVPLIANIIIRHRKQKGEKNMAQKVWGKMLYGVADFIDFLAEETSQLVTKYLSSKVLTAAVIVTSIILIVVGMFFSTKLTFSIFPAPKDSNSIAINISYPSGTEAGTAEEIAIEIEKILLDQEKQNIERVSYYESSTSSAYMFIDLVKMKDREKTSKTMIEEINLKLEEYPRADVKADQVSAGPPVAEYPFTMQIFSNDEAILNLAAEDIISEIEKVELTDNRVEEIAVDNLDNISKLDKKRYIQVKAKLKNPEDTAAVLKIKDGIEESYDTERLNKLGLSEDALGFDLGQETENIESFTSAGIALIVSLLLMYVVLVFQYDSFSQPLLIFSAIPLSFPGLFPGLFFTGNALSFFAMLGLIGLVGIVVNNTIMLVDFINHAKLEGMGIRESVSKAVKLRFRPILTTSTTTIAGLLPLAISDPFWEELAFTIIFGLISSSILVLLVFPAYFAVVEKTRQNFHKYTSQIFNT